MDAPTKPTPLADRMKMHKGGQLTWPEPKLRRKCSDCRHFAQTSQTVEGTKGRCSLVKAHQKVDGAIFMGSEAIACPKFVSAY